MEKLSIDDIKNIIECLKLGYLDHKRDEYLQTYAKIIKIAQQEKERRENR